MNDDIGILLYLLHTLWPKPGHLLQANTVTGQRIVFWYLGGGGVKATGFLLSTQHILPSPPAYILPAYQRPKSRRGWIFLMGTENRFVLCCAIYFSKLR
jgi:hypothetical protein